MKIDNYPYFIELGKQYELSFHPNLSDEIYVDGCFCKIIHIHYVADEDYVMLNLEMYDPQHVVENKEEAINRLIDDIEEFKPYGWYLNDYDLEDWKPKQSL